MVMHARSGGTLEVMGLLLGKVAAHTMIVMDSFALPVEGTETRVNAQAQAYEYMTAYIEAAKQVLLLPYSSRYYNFREVQRVSFSTITFILRLEGRRMLSDGITVTLVTDVGYPE